MTTITFDDAEIIVVFAGISTSTKLDNHIGGDEFNHDYHLNSRTLQLSAHLISKAQHLVEQTKYNHIKNITLI